MTNEQKPFLKRNGVTLITLALFVGAFFAVRWIVRTQRSPGAVTVIEAQGMDMAAMKAPPGVQPVAAEPASFRDLAGSQTFPATAVAFSDEEVIARIPGRVLWTAYPGDRVSSGQVVARLEANEYATQKAQAVATASGSGAMANAAEDEVSRLRSAQGRDIADVSAVGAGVAKAQADRDAAIADQSQMAQMAAAKQSAIGDAQAQLTYQEQDLQRKETLYANGIISLNDFQKSQAAAKSAAARAASAQADASSASSAAAAASKRVEAANRGISVAKAQLQSAQKRVTESSKAIDKAADEARARQAEASASKSGAAGAGVIADYRQLRALNAAMVAERMVSPGSIVIVGQKLLMLHVADPIRLQAKVPQELAAQIQTGSPVSVMFGSITKHATVTSIFPQADPGTRTFTVEALIRNPDHSILPGAFASMQIQTGLSKSSFSVRGSAIQTDANGAKFVWIVTAKKGTGTVTDWTCPMHTQVSKPGPGKCPICGMPLVPRSRGGTAIASRRKVTTGSTNGQYTAVTQGIEKGDQVIWAGLDTLVEGAPVQVTPWGSEGPASMVNPNSPASSEPVSGKEISPAPTAPPVQAKGSNTAKKQLWTCTMHPQVVKDHPGKCPICGMDLVRKKASK